MSNTAACYVHKINPVVFQLWGGKAYYYGLAYALGFLGIYIWLKWHRERYGWSLSQIRTFSILFAGCILICGRLFELIVYEREYFASHLSELYAYWHGGMASHGVLLGAVLGAYLFSRLSGKSFFDVADAVIIPAAFLLGMGRVTNFINGQIYGYTTDVCWAVSFPGVEGCRHPVALYEAVKNFALIPILLFVSKWTYPNRGRLFAHFVFWYGFLRLFSDYYREYSKVMFGIGAGQWFNLLMALTGLVLIYWARKQPEAGLGSINCCLDESSCILETTKQFIFAALILISLGIPSSWTRGALEHYRSTKGKTDHTSLQSAKL
jgi:phosphatidylglycerol---prolipoprotein diacylglyceryl transferase